jgi:MFS family permease
MSPPLSTTAQYPLKGRLAIRVFLCFAFGYLLSYGLRAINAVIAPNLMADLGLSNSSLGSLSAAYFIGFFLMQLPLGHWLDQYGSRKTQSCILILGVVGAMIFAMADNVTYLTIGRGLIGMGVSGCLMSALTFYKRWFKPEIQSTLASAMLMFGTAGAMLMTIPVERALPYIGWRGVFWVTVGLLIIGCVGLYFGLPKSTDPTPKPKPSKAEPTFAWIGGYKPILKSGYFLQVFPMGIFNQGGFHAIQTLWLGVWFKEIVQLPNKEVANYLFIFNLVILGSYAVNLFIPPILNKKGMTTFTYASIVSGFAIIAQIFALYLPSQYASISLFIFGLCSTSFILAQSQFNQFFPNTVSGKASTSFNMLIFAGAFTIQWGIGFFMDLFIQHGFLRPEALRYSLLILFSLQTGSYIWLWIAPYVLDKKRFIIEE